MKFSSNLAVLVFAANLIAGVSMAAEARSYQCAFKTNPKSYESFGFDLQNTDAPADGGKQIAIERTYDVESAKVTLKVQQLGLNQVTLTISQSIVIGTTPVTTTSVTTAEAGTKAITLHVTNLNPSKDALILSCSLI
jgi:hypothetical protein